MVKSIVALFLLGSLAAVQARDMHMKRSPSRARLHRRAGGLTYQLATPEDDWAPSIFEDYVRYHARYMAISCPTQHDTPFFEKCCHPRRVNKQEDSEYPAECSKAVKDAPKPDAEAVKAEQKVYAPLVADGQTGFGGGVAKVAATPSNTTTPTDDDAAAKAAKAAKDAKDAAAAKKAADDAAAAKAAKEAADQKAVDDAAAAKAKAAADAKSAQEAKDAQEADNERKAQAAADAAKKAQAAKDEADAEAEAKKQADEAKEAEAKQADPADDEPEDSDSGSNNAGGIFSNIVGKLFSGGQATWFEQNGVAGACGDVNSEDTPLVALSPAVYGDMGQTSSHCGKTVLIENLSNGKTVRAKVADACPPCAAASLDLSLGAFDKIGLRDTGVLPIKWAFVN